MALTQVEDLLTVPGYTPQMMETAARCRHRAAEVDAVNVNTASAEVLSAVTDMSLSEASALALSNPRKKFVDRDNFLNSINGKA